MATITWSETAATGNVETATNWAGSVAPVLADTAVIVSSTSRPSTGTCLATNVNVTTGEITGGVWSGTTKIVLTLTGKISGGTFAHAAIDMKTGTPQISGGVFSGTGAFSYQVGTLNGGTFHQAMTTDGAVMITGGTFYGVTNLQGASKIAEGDPGPPEFFGTVDISDARVIILTDGVFHALVSNNSLGSLVYGDFRAGVSMGLAIIYGIEALATDAQVQAGVANGGGTGTLWIDR